MRKSLKVLWLIMVSLLTMLQAQGDGRSVAYPTATTEILTLADSIAAFNEFHTHAIGESGKQSDQWKRFERLNSIATLKDWEALNDHPNPVVQAYAYYALAHREGAALLPRLVPHLRDTATVRIFIGCEYGGMPIAILTLQMVTTDWVGHRTRHLTKAEKAWLLRWILLRSVEID